MVVGLVGGVGVQHHIPLERDITVADGGSTARDGAAAAQSGKAAAIAGNDHR